MKYLLASLVAGCLIGGITIASGEPYIGTRDETDTQSKANVDSYNKNSKGTCGGVLDKRNPNMGKRPIIPNDTEVDKKRRLSH